MSTFRSMCAVPGIAVFLSSLISCLPLLLLLLLLLLLKLPEIQFTDESSSIWVLHVRRTNFMNRRCRDCGAVHIVCQYDREW
jgi:hypothetical protein